MNGQAWMRMGAMSHIADKLDEDREAQIKYYEKTNPRMLEPEAWEKVSYKTADEIARESNKTLARYLDLLPYGWGLWLWRKLFRHKSYQSGYTT